jgi:4,5-DOPA dioxygenase extradiol
MTQPSLYVSHGSPMIVMDQSPARSFLEAYGRAWAEKPKAIIVCSAHYEAAGGPALTASAAPQMIYDFGGFPPALYQMQYPAPGAPALAERAAGLLEKAGFSPRLDAEWGFDHGTWTPLKLMQPAADVPVVAMSIDLHQSPQWHFNAGRALAPLREEGVAIIGSGSMTHNLRAFFTGQKPPGIKDNEWVEQFRDWVKAKAEAGAVDDLLDYRRLAPFARENHPTEDHFLPFFVALGAGADGVGKRIHDSVDHDILAMDAFSFA